jgi:hypothetical protein
MFSNTLQMIKKDWNLVELWKIVFKKCNFNTVDYVDFIV